MHRNFCHRWAVIWIMVAGIATADPPDALITAPRFRQEDSRLVCTLGPLSQVQIERLQAGPPTSEQWKRLFRVQVVDRGRPLAPMLGSYALEDSYIVFRPRFPLRPGGEYLLHGDLSTASEPQVWDEQLAVPRPAETPPQVVAIYPQAERLAENQLRFYVQFSRPMARGDVYQYLQLLDELDQPVEDAFLEIGEELWDPEQQRLTLLFDPGRVKRGLRPREEMGPVLIENRHYRLVVQAGWPAADGALLSDAFVKSFVVGPPDDEQPDPARWRFDLPPVGSREPLSIDLGESLDYGMLQRMIHVRRDGTAIAGRIAIDRNETRWHFFPGEPWRAGAYGLRVDTNLEDPAGNSVERPFEVDVQREITQRLEAEFIERVFVLE